LIGSIGFIGGRRWLVKQLTALREMDRVRKQEVTLAEPVVRGSYRLALADTMTIDLLTTAESDTWIRKVARVMHLKTPSSSGSLRKLHEIERAEQAAREHGVLTLRSDGNGTQLVFDVRAKPPGALTVREVWQSIYPFYERLVRLGGLPLHSALVRRGDTCLLVAAAAGTGKSTCCRRLPADWKAICDEEVVLVPCSEGSWHAHPFPTWSDIVERKLDHTWDHSQRLPVSAVFLLEQGEADSAERVGAGEAILFLTRRAREKCFLFDWSLDAEEERSFRRRLFENVCTFAGAIPAYKLTASGSGRFWEEMERALRECSIGFIS